MAFTLDSSAFVVGANNPQTLSFTCGTNAQLVVLGIHVAGTAARGHQYPTYGGVVMFPVANASANTGGEAGAELYYLNSPSTGSAYTISVPNTSKTLSLFVASFNTSLGYTSVLESSSAKTLTGVNPSSNVLITQTHELAVQMVASGANAVIATCFVNRTGTAGTFIQRQPDMGNNQGAMQFVAPTTVANASMGFVTISEDFGLLTGVWRQLAQAPNVPTLFSPGDTSINIPINTLVTWNKSISGPVPSSYGLQLSTSTGFIVNDVSLINIIDTSSYVTGLLNGTNYYWKVNATNATGSSVYTNPWKFTTIIPKIWGGILKYYNGVSWQECTSTQLKFYDGAQWKNCSSGNFKIICTDSSWYPIRTQGKKTVADNFDSYNDGDYLENTANWARTNIENGLRITKTGSQGQVYTNSTVASSGVYYKGTFSNNQWSQATCVSSNTANTDIGVAVRCSSGYMYLFSSSGATTSYITKIYNGVAKDLVTGSAWEPGNLVRLEASGTELYCYRNGKLDTSIAGDGIWTDASITSGNPGISGYNTDIAVRLDNWSGGDL
jgi:hypothetical protein